MRSQTLLTLLACSSALLVPAAVAQDNNPCVPDVHDQFFKLEPHGDALGFYAGLLSGDTICIGDCTCPEVLGGSHYQGIVRKPGPGTPFFYVSKNNDPEVLVIQMGSRDTNGERLRSNRLAPGLITAFTNPVPGDGEIGTADFLHFEFLDDFYGFDHIGGMQAIGNTLVASIDGGGNSGAAVFLDIANPALPINYHTEFFPHGNGGNAIARLNDGRYLLVVGGGQTPGTFVYVSNVAELRNPFLSFQFVGQLVEHPESPPFGYNHIDLIMQCDGTLYLIGTDRFEGPCEGPLSQAALWHVDLGANVSESGSVLVTYEGSTYLNCNNVGEDVTCDFRAAAGTYVSPSGELIIYGTVHQRGDPFTAMAEFRRRDIVHPDVQPWVQLYSDVAGWNSPFGQSITLDMPDRYRDDYLNLALLDFFDNSASSVRWWAPVGCGIDLIANPCVFGNTGSVLTLEGTGQVESIANLALTEFGDNNASAVRFCFDDVEPYGCNQPPTFPSPPCLGCPADVNNDCYVDESDLGALLARWGAGNDPEDINGDGTVDASDLARVLGAWGACYSGPDLVISEINTDDSVGFGQSIVGTIELCNIGSAPAFGFMDVGFSLSIDNSVNSGDEIPMGILHLNLTPPLQPRESRTFPFNTLAVPPGAITTFQNLFVCADLGLPLCGAICEACETNNCSSTPVEVRAPDLVVVDIAAPDNASWNESFTIEGIIRNDGNLASAGIVQVGAWLSLDGNPFNGNGDDIPMGGVCVDATLELGHTVDFSFQSLPVPTNAALGDQKLVVCVDTLGPPCGGASPCSLVCEQHEFNNCRIHSIRIGRPDLIVSADIPDSVGIGQSFSIPGEITNIGESLAFGTVKVDAWLSLDGDPFNGNGDDIWLGNTCVPLKIRHDESAPFVIETLVVPGNAYLQEQHVIVCVDTLGLPCGGAPPCSIVCEEDEFNNCHDDVVDVVAPDLIVSTIIPPENIVLNQSFNIVGEIANDGPVTTFGTVPVAAWLSLDGDPFDGDGNDIPMGATCLPISPSPGGSESFSFQSLFVPPNAALGTQNLVVCVDTFGGPCGGGPPCGIICELEELNNCATRQVEIEAPFWDLRFELITAPNLGAHCNAQVNYAVSVTNVGNATSDNVCLRTGIDLFSGDSNWNTFWPGGQFYGWTGTIPPETTAPPIPVTILGPPACCGVPFPSSQWLKVGINPPCFDNYESGNYDQQSISVTCP